jgi:UDP-N-acetylglucosamine--N-acetylmuramyl-(pentapeptide) pyrophosphoryl-undecaprenol N-acetylglucosamine transferase
MRLLISAGGTGGGVYPALSIVQAASDDVGPGAQRAQPAGSRPVSGSAVLWIGSHGGLEADIVSRAGLPFKPIHGGGVHGVGWRLPLNAWNLLRGVVEALGLVRAFRPDVALVTGGFIAAPTALAAWLSRVPVLVYLPDIEPGLAVRFVGRLARRIAVTAQDSLPYFAPGLAKRVVVTGYPTRPGMAQVTRAHAQSHFGLDPRRPTVLVTGGSRGARSLNRAVVAALPDWLKDYQVVHLSGPLDWPEIEKAREKLSPGLRPYYRPFPYLHEMGLALAAADLVVSRAGASALGEYPLFGLPSVLVPYPHSWRYQKVNADYLVRRGAARMLTDESLGTELAPTVRKLFESPAVLGQMRTAARAAATPEAARRLAHELVQLASQGARR